MNVSEIMTRDVTVARPTDTIQQAARQMRAEDFGSLPVCDGQRLVGILTDRDIAIRAVADGLDAQTPCNNVMSAELYYVHDTDSVDTAAKAMEKRQVRRLPIVDQDLNLVGIVALADLAVLSEDDARKGDVLEEISKPS